MPFDADAAATTIHSCWEGGSKLHVLPDKQQPESLAAGYAVQAAMARGRPVAGWKIAATSAAGQQHIGVSAPLAGRIFADRLVRDDATVSMRNNGMAAAECEFVFMLGKSLQPRAVPYTREEVMDAVASLHPGLELPDSRFTDFSAAGAPSLVADNACAHWMVLGEPTSASWRDADLAAHATQLLIDDKTATSGHGRDALGDPRDALCWLVNAQMDAGIVLEAGQFVTTGVTGAPTPVAAGQRITSDLGTFGQVTVSLTA